ncbi:MAG: 2-amino-4-hydroxy-6-hydroxymethyldihydropteridine diphosphokinase [Spirochaetaceae bacterium]|nr:2-amino-4-hydroxy-6-hydroxymethyldihydropteridine diphosphokinase [Spirochaetaceae bacterium]
MYNDVFIALGSNLGSREEYLSKALAMLADADGVSISAVSGIYETAPVGMPMEAGVPAVEQGAFLNMACRLEVTLSPFSLLDLLQDIENRLGRKRIVRWGPRTIDLDILLYGNLTIQTETLTIPHPRMFERAFVLTPLRDVYPQAEIEGRGFAERIARCADKDDIKRYTGGVIAPI